MDKGSVETVVNTLVFIALASFIVIVYWKLPQTEFSSVEVKEAIFMIRVGSVMV